MQVQQPPAGTSRPAVIKQDSYEIFPGSKTVKETPLIEVSIFEGCSHLIPSCNTCFIHVICMWSARDLCHCGSGTHAHTNAAHLVCGKLTSGQVYAWTSHTFKYGLAAIDHAQKSPMITLSGIQFPYGNCCPGNVGPGHDVSACIWASI